MCMSVVITVYFKVNQVNNKQCWVISIINNVGSVISPWFLQPIRTPCHVKMIFWSPSNAFMRRETKNTKLRPANALFFVLHFINYFHTFEDTTVKTIIFVWKPLYFFRSPRCYRECTHSLYHFRLPSNNLTKEFFFWLTLATLLAVAR